MAETLLERKDYGFDVVRMPDDDIRVEGRSAGLATKALILSYVPAVVISIAICILADWLWSGTDEQFAVFALLFMVLGPFALIFLFDRYLCRWKFAFTITPEGVRQNGKLHKHEAILEVFLDHARDGGNVLASDTMSATQPRLAVVGTGALGAGMLTAGAVSGVGRGIFNLNLKAATAVGASVQYRVGLRVGRRRVFLARRLDEGTATALYHFLTTDLAGSRPA